MAEQGVMRVHPRVAGEEADAQTLSAFLERVSGELRTMAGVVGDMQEGLGPLLGEPAAMGADAFRHAQNIDLVWQTLSGLSDVLALAARDAASCAPLDIDALVAGLPLAELAKRLRGLHGSEPGDDLDLF